MKTILNLLLLVCAVACGPVLGQPADPSPPPSYQLMAAAQLDQLLGPIALYPDPLIAQMLPAATFPDQVAAANAYVSAGGDPNLIDQQPWDPSVRATARYPTVLKWMADNMAWTTPAGQAFLNQQQEVMDAIQRLRAQAKSLGNLPSTPQEQVVGDPGDIEIIPADPQVIYVPVYQPETIYYRSGFLPVFGVGFAFGLWMHHDFDWRRHHVVVWNRDHPRPPNWWHQRHDQRTEWLGRQPVWRHEYKHGPVQLGPAIVAPHAGHPGDRGWARPPSGNPIVGPHVPDQGGVLPSPQPPSRPEPPPPAYRPPVNGGAERPAAGAPIIVPPHVPDQGRVLPSPQPPTRPEPPPPAYRPPANGAFIGVPSSQATRSYSTRGQQSRQGITPPPPVRREVPPVSRPTPPSTPPGNNGDPRRKH